MSLTVGGVSTFNGHTVFGAGSSQNLTVNSVLQGLTPLKFEGTNDGTFITTLAVANPTGNATVTLPNSDITVNAAGDLSGTILASGIVSSSLESVGTLTTLTVAGATSISGNLDMNSNDINNIATFSANTIGAVNITVSGNTILGDASGDTITMNGTMASNIAFGGYDITGAGDITATGTVTGASLAGALTTASQTAITAVGTLTGLTMDGNIALGTNDITGAGDITATGTVTGDSLAGALTTASQTAITAVGTLTGLTMGGNIALGANDITGAGDITATGGVQSATNTITDGTGTLIMQRGDYAPGATTNDAGFINTAGNAIWFENKVLNMPIGMRVNSTSSNAGLFIFDGAEEPNPIAKFSADKTVNFYGNVDFNDSNLTNVADVGNSGGTLNLSGDNITFGAAVNAGNNNITTTGAITTGALTASGTTQLNGAVTLGDTSGDTITVNGTPTFAAAATFNGAVTLGDTSGDTITVNGTPTFAAATTFSAAATFNTTATFNGAVTLGDTSGDTITVNGTPTFASTTTFSAASSFNGAVTLGDTSGDTITVNGTPTFNAAATFNGDVTLGSESADTITVNGTSTFNNNTNLHGDVALGNASGDTITVGGTSTFNATATFVESVSFNNNVTFGDAPADTITMNGTMASNIALGTNDITGAGDITATGTVTGANLAGTLTTASQTAITAVGTLGGLTMGGNIALGANDITGAGDITATGTVTGANLAGTLTTASQTNITSVGTLSSLTVSGDLTVNGTTTTVNSTVVEIADNILLVNSGPSGVSDGGISVKRYWGEGILDLDERGTAQAGAATTITLQSDASYMADDVYVGWFLSIISGTGAGQGQIVTEYDKTTKVATVGSAWETNPDSSSNYCLSRRETGTAQAGASTTITLSADEPATDDYFNGWYIRITNDTPSGALNQVRKITDYDGATKVATVAAWGTNPSSSSTYAITKGLQATAQAGASTTITLAASASASDDTYNDWYVKVIGGTGSGQVRQISDYVGSTKVATVSSAWTTNPDSTSEYMMFENAPHATFIYDESANEFTTINNAYMPELTVVPNETRIPIHSAGFFATGHVGHHNRMLSLKENDGTEVVAVDCCGMTTFAEMVTFNGATTHNGANSFAGESTFTANAIFNDSVYQYFGSDSDMSIRHTGTEANIINSTGNLVFDNQGATSDTQFILGTNDSNTKFTIRKNTQSSVVLSASGDGAVSIPGTLNVTGNVVIGGSLDVTQASTSVAYEIKNGPELFHEMGDGTIELSSPAANDYFGRSISCSQNGDYMIAGAYGAAGDGTDQGAAYVWYRDTSDWSQQAELKASDATDGEDSAQFGYAVAMSGDGVYAAVSANLDNGDGTDKGIVYIYKRSGTSWSYQASLTASDAADSDKFGTSVSLSFDGGYCVVGASEAGGATQSQAGAAYVFKRTDVSWSQQQLLTPADTANAHFGFAVAISGNGSYCAVSAPDDPNSGTARGLTYMYSRSGATWSEVTGSAFSAASPADNDQFGYDLAFDYAGDRLAIGSSGEKLTVLKRTIATWAIEQTVTASDAATDLFATSVDITASGLYIVAGAPEWDHGDPSTANSGAAYIFKRNVTTWTQHQVVSRGANSAASDKCGEAVAISADAQFVFSGAVAKDTNAGKVFAYEGSDNHVDKTLGVATSSATSGSVSMSENENMLVLTGTFSADLTVTLPGTLTDGRKCTLFVSGSSGDNNLIISTKAGESVVGYSSTTAPANTSLSFVYVATTHTWYKI